MGRDVHGYPARGWKRRDDGRSTGSVTFSITKHRRSGPVIDRVRFYFTRTQYFIARGAQRRRTGGSRQSQSCGRRGIVRRVPGQQRRGPEYAGASLSFTVMLKGRRTRTFPGALRTATDLNTRVRSRGPIPVYWTNQTGVAPPGRKALALTFQPSPLGLGPGQAAGLVGANRGQIDGGSRRLRLSLTRQADADRARIRRPSYSGSASLSSLTGPTPASLNLATGRQDPIGWTFTTGSGTGTVCFRGRAQNGATATSIDVSSPAVTIGALSAALSLDPSASFRAEKRSSG